MSFFEAGASIVPVHFVLVNRRAKAAVRSLEFLLLLFRKGGILELGEQVVKLGLEMSEFCAEHDHPPLMRHSEREARFD